MVRRLVTVLVALALAGGVLSVAAAPEDAPPPPPRAIPGLTTDDQFPRGCVDCHLNYTDRGMDTRLSTRMQAWQEGVEPAFLEKVRAFAPEGVKLKGRHPKTSAAGGDVPSDCLKCHSATSKTAPPFGRMIHGIHLTGGENNHFMTIFQGECTHCHKLDPATGAWRLGHGNE